MIQFFRKIRKKNADDNKPIKYMRYAVGEILLLVIGILIALQINNWNIERTQKGEETRILKLLLMDLQSAVAKSLELIEKEENVLLNYEDILGQKKKLNAIKNITSKDSLFYSVLWSNIGKEAPVINSYTDLKNSGKTGLISNENIRIQFTALENRINKLDETLRDRVTLQTTSIDNEIINGVNFVRLFSAAISKYNVIPGNEINYEMLLQNQTFLNIIATKFDMTDAALRDRNLLLEEIRELISLIENELN